MLITDIDVTPLVDSLETMGNNFPNMINTMKKVALLIEMNTEPLVPWDTRALKQSFEYVTGIRGNSIDLIVGYDEEDVPREHGRNDLRYARRLHREPQRPAHQD